MPEEKTLSDLVLDDWAEIHSAHSRAPMADAHESFRWFEVGFMRGYNAGLEKVVDACGGTDNLNAAMVALTEKRRPGAIARFRSWLNGETE